MRKELQEKALRRLKIIEGQVRGLQKMVEEEKYCVEVINQSLAVKKALSSFEDVMLENHLLTHIAHAMKSGKEREATKEMLKVYKLSKEK